MPARQVILTPFQIAYDCDVCGSPVKSLRESANVTEWWGGVENKKVPHQCSVCGKDYTFNVDISQVIWSTDPNGFSIDQINDYILPNKDKDNG
tara:strand:+ start:1539 stop:1817 length:279 start_codon:yes stop_codon:yes gene_type:complete